MSRTINRKRVTVSRHITDADLMKLARETNNNDIFARKGQELVNRLREEQDDNADTEMRILASQIRNDEIAAKKLKEHDHKDLKRLLELKKSITSNKKRLNKIKKDLTKYKKTSNNIVMNRSKIAAAKRQQKKILEDSRKIDIARKRGKEAGKRQMALMERGGRRVPASQPKHVKAEKLELKERMANCKLQILEAKDQIAECRHELKLAQQENRALIARGKALRSR